MCSIYQISVTQNVTVAAIFSPLLTAAIANLQQTTNRAELKCYTIKQTTLSKTEMLYVPKKYDMKQKCKCATDTTNRAELKCCTQTNNIKQNVLQAMSFCFMSSGFVFLNILALNICYCYISLVQI